MTERAFTLREATESIVAVEQRSDGERLHVQIKGLADRNLLRPYDSKGPKRAFRFVSEEIALARVLILLLDGGLSSANLTEFANSLRDAPSFPLVVSGISLSLSAIVREIDEADWDIKVACARSESGNFVIHPVWSRNGCLYGQPDPYDPARKLMSVEHGYLAIEEARTIFFSRLVRPILKHLSDAN